ncbi:hypothetical protein FS837_000432 [Tulasnella sp. UAMH 9824]|nr:hypothetical protein FS837_000432 [Tulasnella sp. UAMH 9824]
MATESFVQPGRELKVSEMASELPGVLEVPDQVDVRGGYGGIYRGTWTNPQGERIMVAVKEFMDLVPNNRYADRDALIRKAEMILQTACGLEHLHSLDPPICHGDIKPENVLINDRLEAVLSDFGLSRVLMGLGVNTGSTTSSAVPGTIRYMAREVFTEGASKCSLQSDVYAFGGLMLVVMSGKPPFFGLEIVQVMMHVLQYQQPRPEDYPEIPSSYALWSLISSCWDKTPQARPRIQEILGKLRELILDEGGAQPIFTPEELKGLEGRLEIPQRPELSAGYSEIFHGIWYSPTGEQVEVAVKRLRILTPSYRGIDIEALNQRVEMRIKREVFIWSRANHPNVHPFLGYRTVPQPMLVSPWCQHGNLSDYLRDNPNLARADKLKLISQAAYGLQHLHSLDPPICYGDIKSENVLINDRLEAVISDFGLGRVMTAVGFDTGLTTSETPKGNFAYLAIELVAGDSSRESREADVYAFGGLVLAAMSGKPPFGGMRRPKALLRILKGEQPTPVEHPGLPRSDALWSLMRRCWDPNPGARPTMKEVAQENSLTQLTENIHNQQSGLLPMPRSLAAFKDNDGEDFDMDLDASVCSIVSVPNPAEAEEGVHSISEDPFSAIRQVLKDLELEPNEITISGWYIKAAVEIGLTLLEIAQLVNSSKDMSASLESNARTLADLLGKLKELSSSRQVDDSILCVADIQK